MIPAFQQPVPVKEAVFDDLKTHKKSLWGLAWASFCWSTASVMVFTLLPVYLSEVMGASSTEIGLIEGVAVFLAFVAKVAAGVLSDYWRRRKPLILWGTFGSVAVKILFAMANSVFCIFIARSIDRFSKGIRSAPTDALIADLSSKNQQGRNYSLRYSLYTMGAVTGGILAAFSMGVFPHNYRLVFWLSILPTSLAFGIIWFFVKQPVSFSDASHSQRWHWKQTREFPKVFWQLLGVSFLLMLARFSEAFLTLRAKNSGWSLASLPLLMVVYDLVSAGMVLPIGKLADRYNRKMILLMGISVLILANLTIIGWNHSWAIFFAIVMAGCHMGMTQALIPALIAENTKTHLRGTAFSLYYLTSGLAVLIGNFIAGYLSDYYHDTWGAFAGGFVFSSLSACYLFITLKK